MSKIKKVDEEMERETWIQREKILDKRRWKAEEDRKWGKVIDIKRNSKRQIEIETEEQRQRETHTDGLTHTDRHPDRKTDRGEKRWENKKKKGQRRRIQE